MKRLRVLILIGGLILLCAVGISAFLRVTAQYPVLGDSVSYPVNQLKGFALKIDEPSWSPLLGYTIRYDIAIDSEDTYYIEEEAVPFERLECLYDGTWRCLEGENQTTGILTLEIGGEGNTGFHGSIVQKYAGYGTRLETGTYRLVLHLFDEQGNAHYLAREFEVD